MRQCEWFRRGLEESLRQSGRGAQKEAGRYAGYVSKSMLSNVLIGVRTTDFKKAILLAHFFGFNIIEFLSSGREIVEPGSYRKHADKPSARGKAHRMIDQIFDTEDPGRIEMAIKLLEAACAPTKNKVA